MEVPNDILFDLQKINELSLVATRVSKNIENFEKAHRMKLEKAEKSSRQKLEKMEKECKRIVQLTEKEITEKKLNFESKMNQERKEFEMKVERFEKIRKEIDRCAEGAKDKIRLNVGGTFFTTYRNTLLSVEDTFFCHLLGTKEFPPDSDGDYFIDRNSTHFGRIMTYLRTHVYDVEGLTPKQLKEFKEEWNYYLFPKINPKFEYVSDCDNNGIMHYLKSQHGTENPRIVTCSTYQDGRSINSWNDKHSANCFQISFHTINISPTHFRFHEIASLKLSKRDWHFQCSLNQSPWVTLHQHDCNPYEPSRCVSSRIEPAKTNGKFFNNFRVFLANGNFSSQHYEGIMNGLEIYGEIEIVSD